MDFGATRIQVSEEQLMLQDAAAGLCAELSSIDRVRALLESAQGYDEVVWQSLVDMGWTGLAIPEEQGGAGLSVGEFVTIFEAMGKYLLTTPLMSTVLAAELLRRSGEPAAHASLSAIAAGSKATVAFLESEDWINEALEARVESGRLIGRKEHVADAAAADLILVPALENGVLVVVVVDASSLGSEARCAHDVIDATRRAQSLNLDLTVDDSHIIRGEGLALALDETRLIGALLVAAESTGAAVSCLNTTVDYLKTRKQFGKLIGSYQALKHPAVDILCAIDSSKSLVYQAASEVSNDRLSRDARVACHMAKSKASETILFAGDRAVQFHGGMGFTYECDAQLYLRRALWAQQAFGDPMAHRKQLASILLDA